MNIKQKLAALLLAPALWASQAWAGSTDLVYAPATSAGHDFNHAPVGQTFIAPAAQVKAGIFLADETSFTNWLATVYPGIVPGSFPYAVAPSLTVNVKLLSGAGVDGAVLHSQDMVLTAPFMGFVDVDYAANGVTLGVGSAYTILVTDISGQAYPNGVVGWVAPSVHDYSTGATLPPGAYAAGLPILQGALVTDDAGIGDNAFHVIDQNPGSTTPPLAMCSGAYATITSVGRDFIVVNGGVNLADHVWYAPQSGTTFTGGTTMFVTGELVSYSGVLDPVAGCYADTMTVMPAPSAMVISGTLPGGQVGSPYSASLSVSGGVAPYAWSVTGLPAGLLFDGGVLSGTPASAGTYPLSVTITDARGATATAAYNVTIADALSCTARLTAQGKGKITAIGSGYVMVGTKKVSYLPCTTLQYRNYSTSFLVGQNVEWEGYTVNGQVIATRIAAK